MSTSLDTGGLQRLIAAGRSLVSRLDVDGVLDELLEVARQLTGAQHAALSILDQERSEHDQSVAQGVFDVFIHDRRPLRLPSASGDSRSLGLPPGYARGETLLAVPIVVRGEVWGDLYLTEKQGGGEFDDADEETAVVLAAGAAIAGDNGRLYHDVEQRRDALERAVLGLEATTQIARAIGSETDLDRVLELIVKRGRALVRARSVLVELVDEAEVVLVAGAGGVDRAHVGRRRPFTGTAVERALNTQTSQLLTHIPPAVRDELRPVLGGHEPHSSLLVPLVFRGRTLGLLTAFDAEGGAGFGEHHERLLQSFAASAATAVATAQSVASGRLRESMDAAERERKRWARELHDETLQALGAVRVLLSAGLRSGTPDALERVTREAVEQLTIDIASLRTLITELRPAALDEFGLEPALEALAQRVRVVEGLELELELDVGAATNDAPRRLTGELETAIYRLVQEALTNAAKHARATRVRVTVVDRDGAVRVEVGDDGRGFDPVKRSGGLGVLGMRERVELAGGTLDIESSPGIGSVVRAVLPSRHVGTGAVVA